MVAMFCPSFSFVSLLLLACILQVKGKRTAIGRWKIGLEDSGHRDTDVTEHTIPFFGSANVEVSTSTNQRPDQNHNDMLNSTMADHLQSGEGAQPGTVAQVQENNTVREGQLRLQDVRELTPSVRANFVWNNLLKHHADASSGSENQKADQHSTVADNTRLERVSKAREEWSLAQLGELQQMSKSRRMSKAGEEWSLAQLGALQQPSHRHHHHLSQLGALQQASKSRRKRDSHTQAEYLLSWEDLDAIARRAEVKAEGGGLHDILGFLVFALVVIAAGWLFRNKLKKFEIRQHFGIGKFLRQVGYDEFDTFSVHVLVHSVDSPGAPSMFLQFHCGAQTEQTSTFSIKESNQVNQTVNLTVAQGSAHVTITAMPDKTAAKPFASKKLSIKEVQKLCHKHQKEILSLGRISKVLPSDIKVELTWLEKNAEGSDDDGNDESLLGLTTQGLSPEMQILLKSSSAGEKSLTMAKAKAQKAKPQKASTGATDEDSEDDEGSNPEDAGSKPSTKLELLAATCRGPLKKCDNHGRMKDCYVAVFTADKDGNPKTFAPGSTAANLAWHFGRFQDEASFMKGASPDESISMLRVTNVYVLPEKEKKDNFCLRYGDGKAGKADLILKKVDRSREVWVESLHLFLEQLWQLKKEITDKKSLKKRSSTGASMSIKETSFKEKAKSSRSEPLKKSHHKGHSHKHSSSASAEDNDDSEGPKSA